jgi:hypothetical protein
MIHFRAYQEVIVKFDISDDDKWNFDETGFCIEIARSDFVITLNSDRRIYFKDSENRKSLISMKCINGTGKNIPSMLILTGVNLLSSHFNNDIDDDIAIATAETGYSND